MSIPEPWEAILLALAAWRVFQLLSADDLLESPRRYVTGRLSDYWEDFITCPYCLGFYLSLGIYLAWIWFPTETLVLCTPFALNAGVIATHKILNSD